MTTPAGEDGRGVRGGGAPQVMVLACWGCQLVFERDLAAWTPGLATGCPRCGGWTSWLEQLGGTTAVRGVGGERS